MIHDHRPYYAKRIYLWYERFYGRHMIAPHFEHLGSGAHLMKPWNLKLHGAHIRAGDNLHVVTAADRKVTLSTWTFGDFQGRISIGDNCLLCPGVRIDSGSDVVIEDDCMLAAGAYVTDADWHDLYDRTRPIGTTAQVTLKKNVWVGDGATICKGVTIGENSVIGAGSVVASDIPANMIAAGNPAKVIKPLDPERDIVTRSALFANPEELSLRVDNIDRYVLHHNSWLGWLRAALFPRAGD